jgi:hypothetical protein
MPRASLRIPISERTLVGFPAVVHGHDPRACGVIFDLTLG